MSCQNENSAGSKEREREKKDKKTKKKHLDCLKLILCAGRIPVKVKVKVGQVAFVQLYKVPLCLVRGRERENA